MARYSVRGKHIYRASVVDVEMGTHPDGTPNIVRQRGPIERYAVGTVLEHVSDDELAAFGDRLELVSEEPPPVVDLAAPVSETPPGPHEQTVEVADAGEEPSEEPPSRRTGRR